MPIATSTFADHLLVRNKNWGRLFTARLISLVGDRFHFLALTAFAYSLHHSALDVGTMLFCRAAPALVLGPFAGVLGDRMNRKTLMMVSDFTRMALVILIPVTSARWTLYCLVFLINAVGTLFAPAAQGLLPQIVAEEDLKNANSLYSLASWSASIVGPLLGGLVVGSLGYKWAFGFDALSFGVSGLLISLMEVDRIYRKRITGFLEDLTHGIRNLTRCPGYRLVVESGVVFMLGGGFINTLLYVYATRSLGASPQQYGFMNTSIAIGAVAGTLFSTRLKKAEGQDLKRLILVGFGLTSVGITLVGLSSSYFVILALLGAVGFGNSLYNIFSVTLVQLEVAQDSLSRAMAFSTTLMTSMNLVVTAAGGALGDLVDTGSIIAVAGGICLLYAVMTAVFRLRLLRN